MIIGEYNRIPTLAIPRHLGTTHTRLVRHPSTTLDIFNHVIQLSDMVPTISV